MMAASDPDSIAVQDNLDDHVENVEDHSEDDGDNSNTDLADDTKKDVDSDISVDDVPNASNDMSDLAEITENKLRLSPSSKYTSSALFSSTISSFVSTTESVAASRSAESEDEKIARQKEKERRNKEEKKEWKKELEVMQAQKIEVKKEKEEIKKKVTSTTSKKNNHKSIEKIDKFLFSSASLNQRKALAEFCRNRNLSDPCFKIETTKNGYLATVTLDAQHFSVEGKERSNVENGACSRAMAKLVKAEERAKKKKKREKKLAKKKEKKLKKEEKEKKKAVTNKENADKLQEETSNQNNVFFSTESLEQRKALMTFCKKRNLPKPYFSIKTKNDGYEATVTIGTEEFKLEGMNKTRVVNKLCAKAASELAKAHKKGFRMVMEEMTMDMENEEQSKEKENEQEEVIYDAVEESVLLYYSDLDPLESRSLCALWTLCWKLNLSVYFARGINNFEEQQWVLQLRSVNQHEAITSSTEGASINETFVGSGTSDEVAKKKALKKALNFLNELIDRS